MALALICSITVVFMGMMLGAKLSDGLMHFGHVVVPFSSLQGSIQTIAFMICIMIACLNCYTGARFSFIVSTCAVVSTTVRVISSHDLSPVPGILNGLMTIVVILFITYLLRRARKRSITDVSTGVLNSAGFMEVLNKRFRDKKSGSLVYYQINNFRTINDDYGHNIGDKVLKTTADRMREIVGKKGQIGRIGGSEFAIVLDSDMDPVFFTQRLFNSLNNRMRFTNDDIILDCFIDNDAGIANFPAEHLEIEITEYSFEESQEQTIKNVKGLKEMGVKVALDDFGTGYASLARLMNLSVDLLKIDKSLVDNIEKGKVNRDFISSISTMGHLLNCEVILEGVETDG